MEDQGQVKKSFGMDKENLFVGDDQLQSFMLVQNISRKDDTNK